jgi:hypothetical protein
MQVTLVERENMDTDEDTEGISVEGPRSYCG